MAAEWFYTRDNQRQGPVSLEQVRQMVADGQLRADDRVWTVGMSQWTPAAEVASIAVGQPGQPPPPPHTAPAAISVPPPPAPPAPPAPAGAADGPAPIGYFSAPGALPPRAAAALRGHAPPTGDTGDWPLDDARVEQFAQAVKLRKKVTGAAQLYRALLLLSLIGLVILVAVLLFARPRGGSGAGEAVAMGVATAVVAAICALYYVATRATMRSRRWAPLTMFILFALSAALNLFGVATAAASGEPGGLMGGVIGLVFAALFAVVSWTSFANIPAYRSQPAWCQELIVKADL